MKRKGIYWLVNNAGHLHKERADLLDELGFSVSFFTSIEELTASLAAKRVSIVIIGDEGEESECIAAMDTLSNLPVIKGARLILSLSTNNSQLCQCAAGNGFRDIIPLSLEENKWLSRFQFSTASTKNADKVLTGMRQQKKKAINVYIPSRLAWINGDQVWIESRARPKMSASLKLVGNLPDDMGCKELDLSVCSHEHRDLVYRFSEGVICDWTANSDQSEKITSVIDELREQNKGPRTKVFLAIQSPALRNTILKYLNPQRFDVHTALQKKSLVSEPKYFTPRLVFIEYRLCEGEAMSRFQEMVQYIPENSTIVVVGAKEEHMLSFRNFSSGRRVESLAQIPKNLPDLILNNYLIKDSSKDKNIYISPSHRFSYSELAFSGKIIAWDEDFIEIQMDTPLANFGLIRVRDEKKNIEFYGKVVSVRDLEDDSHIIVCQVSKPSQKEIASLTSSSPRS